MRHLIEKIIELLPAAGLAAFGGFTRTMAGKERGERYRLSIAIPEIVIAVFSGLLIHWLSIEAGLSENIRTASIALGGYSARSVIAVLNTALLNVIHKKNGDNKNENS